MQLAFLQTYSANCIPFGNCVDFHRSQFCLFFHLSQEQQQTQQQNNYKKNRINKLKRSDRINEIDFAILSLRLNNSLK